MYVYLGLILFQLFWVISFRYNHRKSELLESKIPYFLMFFLAAFRLETVGNDSDNYLYLFNYIKDGGSIQVWSTRYEWGYLIFNKYIAEFWKNQYAIFVMSSLVIYLLFWHIIKRYSKMYWMSVFLFLTLGLYSNSVNVIRLAMAYSICMLAYGMLQQNKYIAFIGLVILATLFHSTAAVFIFVLPLDRMKMSKQIFIVWVVISGLVYTLFSGLLDQVITIKTSYNTYVENGEYFNSGYLATFLNASFWILIIIVVYALYRNNSFVSRIEKGKVAAWEKIILFGLILITCYLLGIKLNLMDRVAGYYRCLMILFIPNAIQEIESKKRRNLVIFGLVILMILFFLIPLIYRPNWTNIYPYSFWVDF